MEWMGESTSPDEMPGLATPEEIAALEQARGVELDDQFTRLMINHHAGGVHMAEFAAESAKLGEVRDFAEQMAANQQREIEELNNARIARRTRARRASALTATPRRVNARRAARNSSTASMSAGSRDVGPARVVPAPQRRFRIAPAHGVGSCEPRERSRTGP